MSSEPIMTGKPPIGVNIWYAVILSAATLLSLGGICYGALHNPNGGGRGGALGVMVAFFALFVRSNLAAESYKATAKVLPELHRQMQSILSELGARTPESIVQSPDRYSELEASVNGILAMLSGIESQQNKMNICIALASTISTLAWGFGDIAADYIKSNHWLA